MRLEPGTQTCEIWETTVNFCATVMGIVMIWVAVSAKNVQKDGKVNNIALLISNFGVKHHSHGLVDTIYIKNKVRL